MVKVKFRKIELKNFRQFYGEQTIQFSTDPQKNITLIHAENGTGKTAFLNAILWCLFEIHTDNFKDPKKLLNKVAKIKGNNSYGVSIEFEDDKGKIFLVQRSFGVGGNTFRVFSLEGDSYKEINNPNSFVNSVIPKDMAKYFFFQGEGIGKMSGNKGTSVVKTAVREILGFTVAEQAIGDLQSIKKEYQRSFSNADKSGELAKLQREITELETNIQESEKQQSKIIESIALYNDKLSVLEDKLSNSNSSVIKQVHSQRKSAELSLQREEGRYRTAKSEKTQLISEFATTVFGFSLSNLALDFINEEEYKGTIPAPFNQQLVSDILSASTCICGSDITPGSAAFNKIQALLKKASDPLLERRVGRARAQLTVLKNDNAKAKQRFLANMRSLSESENAIKDLKKEVEELSIKIQGAESIDDINSLEKERSRIKNNLIQEERTSERVKINLESYKNNLIQKQSELNKLDTYDTELKKYSKLIEYTKKIETVIQSTLNTAEKDVELEIISKVNKYLEQFVRQDYRAKLNPVTFEIRLVDKDDQVVPESDGQALLLSLTFIAALIELSSERKNAQGQILTPGAIAPFIVDAPFGDLDNKYKGHVAQAIPDAVGQVVFLLSSSHWQGTVEENIRPKIGMEYNMVLEVTSSSDNKQDDFIYVQNNKYETVRYSKEVERTVLEKVGEYV